MNKLRKFLTVSVMGMSIIAMSGFAVNNAGAAAQAGDLIKMDGLSSVYYLGSDGKRYVFPNEATYFSWYNDFSSVVTISASELQSYPLGANVTMRPGTKLVKITTDPSVYAVEPNGVLRKIQSEADAITLYGSNWAKRVVDIADSFFTNYVVGNVLPSGQYPVGTLLKSANDATVYYYDGTSYRTISSEAAFNANRFSFSNVITTSMSLSATGSAITGSESIANPYGATTGVQPGQGTGLSVSLAASTPATQDVPMGVAVPVMKFNVTASNDGDITVNGVKFTAIGLGTATDIDGISVFYNNQRLNTSARDIDSNKEAQINFSNGVVIAKGTTATFEVRAKISGTAKYGLSIVKASDVSTTATVSGSFPVQSNIFSGVGVLVGQLTINKDGSSLSEIKLGDKEAIIGKYKLTTSDVEDITIKSISFKKDSASTASDDDVENLKLYYDGTLIASTASISSRYVTFTFATPITIAKSLDNRRLVIKADIVDGAGKDIGLLVDNASDVISTGSHYGYQTIVVGDAINTSANRATIKAGVVTLEKVNATSDKLRVDVDNQEAGTFKITANSGKNVELSTLELTITSTNDNTGSSSAFTKIENVEVYNKTTGSVYDMAYNSGTGAKVYKNDSMGLVLTSGVTNELVVRFDTLAGSENMNYTVAINGAAAGSLVLKELGNDSPIKDITPDTVQLKKVTVEGASVEFSMNALSSSYTAVTGSSDVEMLNFNVKAGENSDVYVKEITVAATSTSDLLFTNSSVSVLKLWKGDTLIKSISSSQITGGAAGTGSLVFTDLNEKVSANTTNSNYRVTVSFVKNTASNGKLIQLALSDVTVEDVDGKDVSLTPGVPVKSARTVTLTGTGTLTASMDNTNASTKDDSYVLAGSQDVAVASVKMKANNEDVKVNELSFIASTSDSSIVSNISEISLWDGASKLAYTNNIGATSTVSGLSLVIPQTEKTYTIKVKLNNYGKDKTASLDNNYEFSLVIDEAQGNSSGDDVTGTTTAVSKMMGIVATKISAVSFESTNNSGVSIASKLTADSDVNAAIVKLTAPSYGANTDSVGNEIKTDINTIKVKVDGNAASTSRVATIERLGGSGAVAATSTIDGSGYATFAITDNSIDNVLASGETAYYLVKVHTAAWAGDTNPGTMSLTVNFDTLNGGNIVWEDGDGSEKTDLRLPGITKIDGITITN